MDNDNDILTKKKWCCYLLSSSKLTYVGATVDVDRRLRQHNGEIVGGAKYTKGRIWSRICFVSGFPEQTTALQFEWKWKQLTKKAKGMTAIHRRLEALRTMLLQGKSTKASLLFSSFPLGLCLHVDSYEFYSVISPFPIDIKINVQSNLFLIVFLIFLAHV
jgi:predicted GIY-YIG superfamily endonuclease